MSGFESLLSAGFNDTAKADLTLFNSIGVTNTPPILSGDIRPEDERNAEEAEKEMSRAERQQREYDEVIAMIQKVAKETKSQEGYEQFEKENKAEFDRNKAKYTSGKDQWQASGSNTDAQSYIMGFDDED